jgi:phenylacetaldehyde dehydrogenase
MATIPVDSRIASKTAEFFSRQHRMLIDGRFVLAASGKTFPVYNPATGEVVARVPEAEEEDVNRAVSAARRAFDEGPWSKKLSPSERGQMLWKLADLLQANLE